MRNVPLVLSFIMYFIFLVNYNNPVIDQVYMFCLQLFLTVQMLYVMVMLWYMSMVIIQYYIITVTRIPWYCLNNVKLSGLSCASLHYRYHAESR